MAGSALDDRIDQLYQLPLDEFTAARNALAKEAGERAAEVKKLEKPNLAAWTVNQLYWRERKAYDEVIKAAERMRAVYKQMLAGKTADVRGAEEIHQEALKDAKQAARRILEEGGHHNPDTVMMPVAETLDALPGEEPPGRLTKPLRRMGFNVLEGVPISAKAGPIKPKAEKKPEPAKEQTAKERKASETEARELAMVRERLRFVEAAEREAEASRERATRAVERAERTHERIERELKDAADALKSALKEQAAAQKALDKAAEDRDRLQKKLRG
jgi:DNA repair exonuclease SbcCD ATPase subunit